MEAYKPKDIILFNFCQVFFKKALDVLEQYLKSGGHIPVMTYYEPVIHLHEDAKSKSIEYIPYEVRDFRFLGTKYYQELLGLPELKAASSYISEKKYLLIGKSNFAPDILLYDALKDFLTNTGSIEYQEKGFLDAYAKIENLIFNDEMLFRSTAKLENFFCAKEVIKFGDMHFIKRYTQEECKELYRHPTINIFDHTLPLPGDFRIEALESKDKNNWGQAGIEGRNEIIGMLTTLRLYKDSAVVITTLEMSEPVTWFPFSSKACQLLPSHIVGDVCTIEENDIIELVNLWKILKGANYKNCPSLEVAIKRFNYAHEHIEREDSLIDIMIGFEALYMKREEREELRF